MLGTVNQVNDVDVSVSLPNGLLGWLSLREVSDEVAEIVDDYLNQDDAAEEDSLPKLHTLLKPGQVVRVAVVTLDSKKKNRIELSMRASLINSHFEDGHLVSSFPVCGAVRSVEDRGTKVARSMI